MNRPIISVLFVLLLCVVALGFYRGWFTLSNPSPDAESNKVNVNLTVDRDKIKEDAETVKKEATQLVGKVAEQATGPADQTTEKVKSND